MYSHAPSFDLFGSFFPVWMFCIALSVLLTVVVHHLLVRVRIDRELGPRIVVYPGLVTLFACAIWLLFFES